MDARVQELIDFIRTKFGLHHYDLKRHRFARHVNLFNQTVYTLSMEWFPDPIIAQEDEDLNPDGTAVIDIDVKSRRVQNVIFVGGKTYARGGIAFAGLDKNGMIQWIEQETGLTYGLHFQLEREEPGAFNFQACFDGIPVSPPGFIELRWDPNRNLTLFSVSGPFPSEEMVREESYALSLEKVEHLTKDQFRLIELPSYEEKRLVPVYALEELFVTNDGSSTLPFGLIENAGSFLEIDNILSWNKPLALPFESQALSFTENITAEQAFTGEPHPDSLPITKPEQEQCVEAVRDFLRRVYPNDSGKWRLHTLHRENGYIHATLRESRPEARALPRKLIVMIDAEHFQAVNYMDNQVLLEIFGPLQAPEKVKIKKEEAYEKIKDGIELKPFYVYDFTQKQYVLCGKFDCGAVVNAASGEVLALDG